MLPNCDLRKRPLKYNYFRNGKAASCLGFTDAIKGARIMRDEN